MTTEEERNWRQDRLLSDDEIERLKNAGFNIHKIKGRRNVSQQDLYKDGEGNIYVRPKGLQ
ncbi:polymorphic toxin type 33 domain-containing protein [Pannus brasiliensis CCIBt3594]|uniref:Polymorphic toxin type 33 domain-containing protein n=1 Tax=Pannus brasiliensis CCIBt3594 TaxID=1427578 RepID=A0AAW9QZB6_9CHRO